MQTSATGDDRVIGVSDGVLTAGRTTAGELRGYLTVVPEIRWIKHAGNQEYFFGETMEHYEEHTKELRAILDAVR